MNQKGQEIEVKFFVSHLEAVEAKVIALGGEKIQSRVAEVNLRFDTPEHDLERGFRVLRLRHDTCSRLTYKGPGLSQEGVRVRQEIEFEVSDFDAAKAFLHALGYRISMIYEKFRAVYRLDECDIALDELPYGAFVEIEGPNPEAIRDLNTRLGLEWEASVPSSYAVLFEALRQRMNLPFRDLTFDNFKDLLVSPELLGVRPADEAKHI